MESSGLSAGIGLLRKLEKQVRALRNRAYSISSTLAGTSFSESFRNAVVQQNKKIVIPPNTWKGSELEESGISSMILMM